MAATAIHPPIPRALFFCPSTDDFATMSSAVRERSLGNKRPKLPCGEFEVPRQHGIRAQELQIRNRGSEVWRTGGFSSGKMAAKAAWGCRKEAQIAVLIQDRNIRRQHGFITVWPEASAMLCSILFWRIIRGDGHSTLSRRRFHMGVLSILRAGLGAFLLSWTIGAAVAAPADNRDPRSDDTYTADEIVKKGADFFGVTTEAMGKAVEKVFAQYGRPNAYIAGNEGSGAIVVGLRYGEGDLYMKQTGTPLKVFWQGPSVGFDYGANASKVFPLVYRLPNPGAIYERFPGVEGSAYFVAGIGVNYQQNGRVILAPMRTGVGVRAGVNAGYLSYSKERNWIPF